MALNAVVHRFTVVEHAYRVSHHSYHVLRLHFTFPLLILMDFVRSWKTRVIFTHRRDSEQLFEKSRRESAARTQFGFRAQLSHFFLCL